MSIKFHCSCGQKLKASDQNMGKKILCSHCGNPVTVPMSAAVAEPVAVPSEPASKSAGELMKQIAREGRDDKHDPKHDEKHEHHKKKGFYKFDEEEKPKPSVMATLKQQGKPLLLGSLGLIAAVVVVYWIANAAMGSRRTLPPLGQVSGEVTIDGRPLANATLTFTPDTGIDRTKRVSSSMGITDSKGRFTLEYVDGVKGAAVGKHRVTIRAVDEKGYEQVDGSFNAVENQQVVEVKSGTNPPLSFKVPRAPTPPPAQE